MTKHPLDRPTPEKKGPYTHVRLNLSPSSLFSMTQKLSSGARGSGNDTLISRIMWPEIPEVPFDFLLFPDLPYPSGRSQSCPLCPRGHPQVLCLFSTLLPVLSWQSHCLSAALTLQAGKWSSGHWPDSQDIHSKAWS